MSDKRNPNSIGSIQFFIRQCLDFEGCHNYVEKLLHYYEIDNYKIEVYKHGVSALFIYLNEAEYIIEFDIKRIYLKVTKDKKECKIFDASSCYRDSLLWILKDSEVK